MFTCSARTLLPHLLIGILATSSLSAQNSRHSDGMPRSAVTDRNQGEEYGIEFTVEDWIEGGGRLDWSRQGDKIGFDRQGTDGLFDIYVLDVESGYERCLTCETYEFRKSHCLSPAWHPSGDFLVMTVQRNAKKLGTGTVELFGAARAPYADIWILRADGKAFWQITQVAEVGSAVLDPQFSFEGEQLAWSERTTTRRGGRSGAFRTRTGQLRFRRGVPSLRKYSSPKLPSNEALVHIGSFSSDDASLLVAANFASGQSERGLDIYRVPLAGGEPERLTHTRASLDLAPIPSPRSPHIAFISAADLRARPVAEKIPASELWLMKRDGSDQVQLTYFNSALSDEYRGATAVGDFAWSPDGRQLALQLLSGHREAKPSIVRLKLGAVPGAN